MSRKISVEKKPYDEKLFSNSSITIKEGINVLVGCNGSGKTTMMRNLISEIKKLPECDNFKDGSEIACIDYNNLMSGGIRSCDADLFHGDIAAMATKMFSSEGENIVINVGSIATKMARATTSPGRKEVWVFMDAIDSGLSIDNVLDLNQYLFVTFIEHAKSIGVKPYIVISANAYEVTVGAHCIDVSNGKKVSFANYDEYKDFIIKSREFKDKRQNQN